MNLTKQLNQATNWAPSAGYSSKHQQADVRTSERPDQWTERPPFLRVRAVDQMRDLKKKNGKPFSCFAYMLVLWVDYSIGEYSLMSYTGCSRLPQSKAAAVGEFQEDQWAPIDRVGEFTSAFFFPIDQVKKIQLITRLSDRG